jgi:hypothetical protein
MVQDVRSCREADSDLDHYMLRVRYRQRVACKSKKSGEKRVKYNLDKFNEKGTEATFQQIVSQMLESKEEMEYVENDWKIIQEATRDAAVSVLFKRERQERKPWYDDECKGVVENRNRARMKMISCGTRANARGI